jgi:two-component system, NarL family, response regulator LiaR
MEDSSPDRSSLTPREREVLALIGRGKSTKQIALTLGIALSTVTSHREHIKNKWARAASPTSGAQQSA